jgi:membrane associated rhomboid family serine protease
MIPLRDSHPTDKKPVVTYFLILANVLVFLLEIISPDLDEFVSQYALVPIKVNFLNFFTLWPFLSFQFLHGGLFHLFSNMWFLKIFADNVEERMGHLKFLVFYLFAGIVAGLSQYVFLTNSTVPMIGASGSVAGVLGAYFVFFPHHRIETLIPGPLFWHRINLPAAFVLFYWFATQLFAGFGSLVYMSAEMGGVAFIAHAGGFIAGWLIAKTMKNT